MVKGTVFLSDKPCASPSPSAPSFGHIGPSRTSNVAPPSYVPPMSKQQAYVKYLGAGCTSLNDALRTAAVRGVGGNELRDLRQEYANKCMLEDLTARSKELGTVLGDQVQRYKSEASARDEAQRHATQCSGMLDVLRTKRSRVAGMDDDEKAALRSLEASYNERCLNH